VVISVALVGGKWQGQKGRRCSARREGRGGREHCSICTSQISEVRGQVSVKKEKWLPIISQRKIPEFGVNNEGNYLVTHGPADDNTAGQVGKKRVKSDDQQTFGRIGGRRLLG